MKGSKYINISVNLIPPRFTEIHGLDQKIYRGHLYMEIQRGMYGLSHAEKLANVMLKETLAKCGY